MPEGTSVALVPFCFGIAQESGEIPNAPWKENNWELFFPTEHLYHQNFSHMKRDTIFFSFPTLLHSFSYIPSSQLVQESWYPSRQNSGIRTDIEIWVQVWIHQGNGCFCFPFFQSPSDPTVHVSASQPAFPQLEAAAIALLHCALTYWGHCVMKEDLLPALALMRTEIIADGGYS